MNRLTLDQQLRAHPSGTGIARAWPRTPRSGPAPRFLCSTACLLAVVQTCSGRANAKPQASPPLSEAVTRALHSAGYRDSRPLALGEGVVVLQARKGRRARVVAAVCGPATCARRVLVLASVKPRTTLTATVGRFAAGRSLVEARVTARTRRADGGSASTTTHYLLRTGASPTLACAFVGSRSRNPGPRCGSGLMEWVTVKPVVGVDGQFEVVSKGSGLYSVRDPRGGCVQRSPVRGRPFRWRYTIPRRGQCTKRRIVGP
jgi:uncharacterized metal-binding protein